MSCSARCPSSASLRRSPRTFAVAAGDVVTEAVRIAGGSGKWTAAEATQKGEGVAGVDRSPAGDVKAAQQAANRVLAPRTRS